MLVKVYFDTDGYELTTDEAVIDGVTPTHIIDGVYAYYNIKATDFEDFVDALDDFNFCFFSVGEVDDEG